MEIGNRNIRHKVIGTAYEEGAKYLAHRMRTAWQVISRLKEYGFPDEEVNMAVAELRKDGFIDDEEYAYAYIRNSFKKGRSVGRTKFELEKIGVDEISIDDALYRLENQDVEDLGERIVISEEQRAKEVMGKVLELSGYDSQDIVPDKVYGKVVRRLASCGYSSSMIFKVAGTLNRDGIRKKE
ncbi:MAG: recombination regulator RecX [Clostridiales bacterium]|nr:recombination regulator RecX [Clostridiales bacterium]